jgi:hypothetical protein
VKIRRIFSEFLKGETPNVLDQGFIRALRRYAQFIARAALSFGGGLSLSLDIKVCHIKHSVQFVLDDCLSHFKFEFKASVGRKFP